MLLTMREAGSKGDAKGWIAVQRLTEKFSMLLPEA